MYFLVEVFLFLINFPALCCKQVQVYFFKLNNIVPFQVFSSAKVVPFFTYMKLYIFSYVHTYFFRSFSTIGYYKMLNIVPCAIQYILVVNLYYL